MRQGNLEFQEVLQRALEKRILSSLQPDRTPKTNPLKTRARSTTFWQSSERNPIDLTELDKKRNKQDLALKPHHLAMYAKTPPSQQAFLYTLKQSERILKLEHSEFWGLERESPRPSPAYRLLNEALFNEQMIARAKSLLY
ncbi:MAG: hypothetical protein ACTTH5_00405 [Wolinella sp.]